VDVVIPTEEYGSMGDKIHKSGLLEKLGYTFFYDKKVSSFLSAWSAGCFLIVVYVFVPLGNSPLESPAVPRHWSIVRH
jgi:hypothetical protein